MSKPFSHKSFEPHITLLTFIQGIMYINRTFISSIYTYLSDNQCTLDGSGLNSGMESAEKWIQGKLKKVFSFIFFCLAIKWRNSSKVIKREVVTKKISTISAHIFLKLAGFYFGKEKIFLLKWANFMTKIIFKFFLLI